MLSSVKELGIAREEATFNEEMHWKELRKLSIHIAFSSLKQVWSRAPELKEMVLSG